MKGILFSLLPAMAALQLQSVPADPLPIGASIPKPEVRMMDVGGKEHSLQDLKTDKGLLVMFSCNTCPYVIRNQSRTNDICRYAGEKGIGVAVLNPNEAKRGDEDSYPAMKAYAEKQGYKWPYLVDRNHILADAFGANRTPECFLFDGDGKLVYHGAIDDNPNDASAVTRKHLQVAIDELRGGKEISVKETRSVGCSIKRQ
ncbi:MAG: hypothetical protein RJA57_739 [Bacteroidota bacterium]